MNIIIEHIRMFIQDENIEALTDLIDNVFEINMDVSLNFFFE
jgi:predicted house-cleaning noncanonical NTP pyrophosphatase (MazG superfamily)